MTEQKKKILVVEDEESILEMVQRTLELKGFEVFTAGNVEESLKQIEAHDGVDAIWLDHYLTSGEEGADLVKRLRESKWSEIPVFLVSNTASTSKIQNYIELGVDRVYTKLEYHLDEIAKDILEVILR